MKRLLVLGASGHGKVVGDCAREAGLWDEIVFFDDRWPEVSECGPWDVRGRGTDLLSQWCPGDDAFVAIGNSEVRHDKLNWLMASGVVVATLVHPKAIVSKNVTIGVGTLVAAGAVINIGSSIGKGCILNTGATVDHDCVLSDGVHVCPGANIAGDVNVGLGTWLGIGSSVIQCLRIGSHVTVGAGAVVIHDVEDGMTVVGVPARPIGKRSEVEA